MRTSENHSAGLSRKGSCHYIYRRGQLFPPPLPIRPLHYKAATSRSPSCHNSQLLEHKADIALPEDEVLAFLKKRRNILEGVCITGGEPTLQPDLEEFICKVRSLGLAVKLDTNGYRPEILKMLCQKGRIDAVALDIKAGPSHYERVFQRCP